MNIQCLKCKGADLSCGRIFCPIIAKAEAMFKVQSKTVKEDFFGSSPAPFVGRYGYPDINVGILAPPEQREDAWLYDAPNHWAQHNFQIPEIVDYRSSLINSRFRVNVKQKTKFLEISQEIGMASKPVDLEINLKEKPRFKLNTDSYLAPTGPNASLEQAKITSNPKIDSRVDKIVSDTDLKASHAMTYLYDHGFSENFLTKILSIGNLGIKPQRKLVPTRWSITATDDTLAKYILSEVKQYKESDYQAYFGNYLGNYFIILLFPEVWSYELFETYAPNAEWNISDQHQFMTDYEPYDGRKTYADNCGGGYYAARLSILEQLSKIHQKTIIRLQNK